MDIRLLGTNWKLQTAEYDAYLKKYIDFSSFACKSNSVQTKIQVLLPSPFLEITLYGLFHLKTKTIS